MSEDLFPVEISHGSTGGPEFLTEITAFADGHEQRNQHWIQARLRFNPAEQIKTTTQLTEVRNFFNARQGRYEDFRYRDWSDYAATDTNRVGGTPAPQLLGTGDDARTEFQLRKTYTVAAESYLRPITKPVAGTVRIFLDAVEQFSGWSADTATGLVTFDAPVPLGLEVTALFQFHVPVRFDVDSLPQSVDSIISGSFSDLRIIEVRTADACALADVAVILPGSSASYFPAGAVPQGSQAGPAFLTQIVELAGGSEARAANWSASRLRLAPVRQLVSPLDMAKMLAFFYVMRGRLRRFNCASTTPFAYDLPVRFDTDYLPLSLDHPQLGSIGDLSLIELLV